MDTVAGVNASANLPSLLQTCIKNKIDRGYRYLKALFVELPKAKTLEDFEALVRWSIAIDHHRSSRRSLRKDGVY